MANKVILDDTWYYITFPDLNLEYKCKNHFGYNEAVTDLLTDKQFKKYSESETSRIFNISDKRTISVSEDLEAKKLLKII